MAFSGITATEDEIDQKLGKNIDLAFTDTMKTQALLMAESVLNVMTRFNWSDWYATTPNSDIKYIVTDATTAFVAIEGIRYNMEQYIIISEAEAMIANLRETFVRNISILKNINSQTFIFGA
jgi:hypothetical protein